MSKTLHLKLDGEAETFFKRLAKEGLSEKESIAKALWLFQLAWETGRVALLDSRGMVQSIFIEKPSDEAFVGSLSTDYVTDATLAEYFHYKSIGKQGGRFTFDPELFQEIVRRLHPEFFEEANHYFKDHVSELMTKTRDKKSE